MLVGFPELSRFLFPLGLVMTGKNQLAPLDFLSANGPEGCSVYFRHFGRSQADGDGEPHCHHKLSVWSNRDCC